MRHEARGHCRAALRRGKEPSHPIHVNCILCCLYLRTHMVLHAAFEHRSSSRPTAELADFPHAFAFSAWLQYTQAMPMAIPDLTHDVVLGSAVPSIRSAWTGTDCPQGNTPTARVTALHTVQPT